MTLEVGDLVTRMLSGVIPMQLRVTKIDDKFIYCGLATGRIEGWKFDRTFGYEVDEDLGWGVKQPDGNITTGSWLVELMQFRSPS